METFVSDLLETADLRVITKKDVRVKYKNFIGRDISSDEKARINDLVYAFVYYYAAKQKKTRESKLGTGGSSPGDKENKQKHVKEKGTRDGQKVVTNKSPLLKDSDKHNKKRAPRKNIPTEKEYKDKPHFNAPEKTKRKVYPQRSGKESRRMKITEVVSAIMDTTNSDSSWSTDSDSEVSDTDCESEVELNEKEREQLKQDVKKVQQAREVRIKLAKDRQLKKKSTLAKIVTNGQDVDPSSKVKKLTKGKEHKKPIPFESDDNSVDSVLLLSDADSDDLPLTVIRDKSTKQESDSHTKSNLKSDTKEEKQIKTEPFCQAQSSVKIKKKKDHSKLKLDTSQSDDCGKYKLNKTPGGFVKSQKSSKNSVKKEKNVDKNSELKRNIATETDTESEGSKPIKKKSKLNIISKDCKDQKKSIHGSEKSNKLSKAIKVKKKADNDNIMKKMSIHSKNIVKNKKVVSVDKKAKYFKVLKDKKGKKVLDSVDIKKLVKKKREEAALRRVKEKYKEKAKNFKKSDSKSSNTKVLKKINSSKTLSSDAIKELVKKKREAAVLKKIDKEKKRGTGKSRDEAIEITSESQNGDMSESNSEISDRLNATKSKMNKSITDVSCDTDSPDMNSSISEHLDDSCTIDSEQDSEGTVSTMIDSPIKTTPSQVKKKKMRRKNVESDAESLQNGPSSKKSKLSKQTDNKISSSCDKLNKNGLHVVSEDSSSEEDIPLSHIKARLTCHTAETASSEIRYCMEIVRHAIEKEKQKYLGHRSTFTTKPAESPHLIELRQICAASGIDIVDDQDLKRCLTNGAKIKALRYILKEAGMKGLPNMKKAEELKVKREEAAKDTSHILLTETGRARRKVKSIYARLMKPKSNTDTSETDDNDTSCLSETDGNEKGDKDIPDDNGDTSDNESSKPKEMNLFERLKGLGDSESSD